MTEGLFEKITGHFADEQAVKDVNPSRRRFKSICDYLNRLLNTRQGSLAHLPDYGMPDLANLYRKLPATMNDLRLEITTLIQKYEPRLKHVQVKPLDFQPLNFKVTFEITAVLTTGEPLKMETSISPTGAATSI
jgi:type VI secretion system protein